MIIKIPLRISFIGGGTDFPEFYNEYRGLSISTTFDKYVNITDDTDKWKIQQNHNDLIEAARVFHNSSKEILVAADIPPGSGLGTSSAIAVGLTKMLSPNYEAYNPRILAENAIEIERKIAGILGGHQDQYASAYCGTNLFEWNKDRIEITPIEINPEEFAKHLILINTKITRRSKDLMEKQIKRTVNQDNNKLLKDLVYLTEEFHIALKKLDFPTLGHILKKSWLIKKQLAPNINIKELNQFQLITKSLKNLFGFKLMGAGGGGYILVICKDRDDTALELASFGYEPIKPNLVNQHQMVIK